MNKFFKFLIVTALIAFAAVNITKVLKPAVETQMVQHGEMEKAFSFDGIILRDETLVKSNKSGVLEAEVSENEMVRKGKHIASVYEDSIDENVKKKLTEINERISEIESTLSSDENTYADNYRIESAMDAKVSELMLAYENRDVSKLVSIKNEIGLLNDKKNAVMGDKAYSEKMLAQLKNEKSEYEKSLSSDKDDLYSPIPGIFSTKIDGYEEIISLDAADKLTPEDFDAIKKTKAADSKKVACKIIDSFEWAVAVTVTENELANLKTGDVVSLRMQDSNEEVEAKITYISTPDKGKYVLVATSDVSCDWSLGERFVKLDFVKNKYSGLKIPTSAIRVQGNKTGVFVLTDDIVKFKPVNIYYKDSKNAIVEENNAGGGLLLYDEVIVSSGNFKSGKRLTNRQKALR